MLTTTMRRVLAVLAATGVAAAVILYVDGISGTTTDERSHWVAALVVGAILINIPMFVLEPASVKDRTFYWQGFGRGLPRWAVPLIKMCWVIVLAHGAWFFVKGSGGVPLIQDGQFILGSHGRIVRVLTQSEYLSMKADELRLYAVLMFACYLAPMMYWWFPRKRQTDEPAESP